MNKVEAQNVKVGMTIGKLNGVVNVASVTPPSEGKVKIGVSIGTLRDHKVTFDATSMVEVVNMQDNLRGWYGI